MGLETGRVFASDKCNESMSGPERPVFQAKVNPMLVQRFFLTVFLILLCTSLGNVSPAPAASPEHHYQRLSQEFRHILGITQLHEQKASLEKLAHRIRDHIQRDTAGSTLDRAFFLLGQCHHRLYDLDHSRTHLNLALENYRYVTLRYPRSTLADDAQYLIGILYLNLDPKQAHAELSKVVYLYPSGDMVQRAQQRLEELERRFPRLRDHHPGPRDTREKGPDFSLWGESVPARMEAKSSLSRITDIRHWSGEEYTRVAIYTDFPVTFRETAVPGDPKKRQRPKIHLDLANCSLDPAMQHAIAVKDSFLQEVRLEKRGKSATRVTLDAQAIDRYRVFSMSDPFRIIVDVRGSRDPARKPVTPPPSPSRPPLADLPAQLALGVERIVIDPGHGGKDKGAISSNGLFEKDIVLSIAQQLKVTLERETDMEVLLTREDDRFLTLEERTAMANAKRADLFISIHTNAHRNREVSGIETYFLNFATDQEAARVAAMENATSTRKISDLESILQGLMLNTKLNESTRLAHAVQNNMIAHLSLTHGNVQDRGVKQAPFYVLLGAEMPSILIEAGFITNESEEKRLKDHRFQAELASAITRGVLAYVEEMKSYARLGGRP